MVITACVDSEDEDNDGNGVRRQAMAVYLREWWMNRK